MPRIRLHSVVVRSLILVTWLSASVGALLYLDYEALSRGVMCMVRR